MKLKLLGPLLAFLAASGAHAADRIYAEYGQKLIDDALAKHPQVIALTLRAKPSNRDQPADIRGGVAPSFGGSTVVERGPGTDRTVRGSTMEVRLQDVAGDTVGSIDLVFSDFSRSHPRDRRVIAESIQREIGARIWNADSLFETFPVDPSVPYRTYAQGLIEKILERHPELLVLCLHLTPPGQEKSITFACNVGRIGMVDDSGDTTIMRTGQSQLQVMAGGKTIKIEGPLRDAKGQSIGAFSVFYAHKPGDSEAQFEFRARNVGQELARQIPDLPSLAGPRS